MSTQIPDHPAIDAVLSTAASVLGMEIVFLGGLTDDTFTFEGARHASAIEVPVITAGTATGTE